MCKSIRQRSLSELSQEQSTLLTTKKNSNTSGITIVHLPTNTTTIIYSRIAMNSPDGADDEQEAIVDEDDEGGTSSKLKISPRVLVVAPEIILPRGGDDDEDDTRSLVVTTTPRKNNNNQEDHDHCFTTVLVPVVRGGHPLVLAKQQQQEQSSTKKKKERRVSIDGRVHVQATLSRIDITPQERVAAWYSSQEFKEITESCCKQVKKLNRGEVLKDKKYCARGLESYTHTRSKAKHLNRLLAYEALWEEEERQALSGIQNDEALARVYHAVSSSCQLWAQAVALGDQKEADNMIAHDYCLLNSSTTSMHERSS